MKDVRGVNRRFVFVIDNLDRLAESDALQMWATIRSFFLLSDESEDVGYESYHPVVVLPVDVHAIEKMFALTEDENVARELVASFINKTFDVTFEVTEPVMSDWREFMDGQFSKVFSDQISPEKIYLARTFYEDHVSQGNKKITPREINKFVNRTATLYLQWHSEGIDFGVLAYYAIHSRQISDSLLRIITSTDHPLSVVGDRWQEQIAAVYYGVPLEKAAQVVLDQPLRDAILSLDKAKFSTLTSVPGFGDTLKRISLSPPVTPAFNVPQFKFVTNLALLLAGLPEDGALWKRDTRRNMAQDYVRGDEPSEEILDLNSRVAALSSIMPGDLSQAFVDKTATILSNYLTANGMSGPFEDRVSTASTIVDYAESHHLSLPTIHVDEAPRVFLTLLADMASIPKVWSCLRSTVSLGSAFEVVVTMLRSSEDCDLVPSLVRILSADGAFLLFGDGNEEPNWDIIRGAAAEILRNPAGAPYAVIAATNVLGSLLAQEEAWDLVEQLADDGTLQARLNDSYSDGRMEAVAAIAAFLIWRADEFTSPAGGSWRKPIGDHPDLVKEIHSKIREFFGSETIWDIWTSYYSTRESRVLLEELIKYQIENNELGQLNVASIVAKMGWYKYPVPWRLERRFLDILERHGSLLERMEGAKSDDNFIAAAELVSRNKNDSDRLGSLILARTKSASADDWKVAVESGGGMYDLTVEFKLGESLAFGVRSPLAAALRDTIDHILATSDYGVRRRWFELAGMLRRRAEKQVLAGVSTAFLHGNKIHSPVSLLRIGGPVLLRRGGFDADPDLAIEKVVLPNMLNRPGRAWLNAVNKEIRPWISKAGATAKRSIFDRLDRFERGDSPERKYWAAAMRANWG